MYITHTIGEKWRFERTMELRLACLSLCRECQRLPTLRLVVDSTNPRWLLGVPPPNNPRSKFLHLCKSCASTTLDIFESCAFETWDLLEICESKILDVLGSRRCAWCAALCALAGAMVHSSFEWKAGGFCSVFAVALFGVLRNHVSGTGPTGLGS